MNFEQLQDLIADHLNINKDDITPSTSFEALGIDSLDTVELVMAVEDSIGRELEMKTKVTDIQSLLNIINGN